MTSSPPFDRAVALACALRTFRERWLYVQCGDCKSGNALLPIKMMLRDQPERASESLADTVVRLRCAGCKARPAAVALLESHCGHLGPDAGGPENKGWRLELHPR